MLINYSTTDLNSFLSRAEQKLVRLGEVLVQQINWDEVEDSLLDKIELLTYIIDEIDRSSSQDEIDKLVYFALDYYNLHEIPYAPFSIMPTTVIGSSGSGGVSSWDDLLDKPSTFPPSPHTHFDEDVNVSLVGITEFLDRFSTSFTGTLEEFLEKLMIKYQNPAFTAFTQSLGTTFEIGQTIPNATVMNLIYTITNGANVKNVGDSGSFTLSEISPFVSNTPFNLAANLSGRTLTFASTYTKTSPGTFTITINGVNSNSISMNALSTSLTWYSRIWYGNDVDPTVTALEVQAFNSFLTNTRNSNLTIAGSGYKYIFIPDNIDQTGITFTMGAFPFAMNAPTNLTVVNPQGLSVAGKLYRSVNTLGGSVVIRVA